MAPGEFQTEENNVIKEGSISLRPKDDVTHYPLPIDYLHIVPKTLGHEMNAGLLKKMTGNNVNFFENTEQFISFHNYPNLFNPTTFARYILTQSGIINLRSYWREAEMMIKRYQKEEEHQRVWNAYSLANGIYLCKF